MTTNILSRLRRPCTIRYWSEGPPDAQNNPSDLWNDVDTVCIFQQRGRQAVGDVSDITAEVWWCWFDPDTLLPTTKDRINVDGVEYAFRGDSWLARSLDDTPDHIEATCMRAA